MFKNKMKKAFTLIELIIVISIIGILAATIVVGAQSYRNRAKDDRIKSDLMQIRALSETIYERNEGDTADAGTYKNVRYLKACVECKNASCSSLPIPDCGATPYRPEWKSLMDDITKNGGTLNASWYMPGGALNYTKFAASSILNDGTNWCVDSSNYAASGTTAANSGVCTPS